MTSGCPGREGASRDATESFFHPLWAPFDLLVIAGVVELSLYAVRASGEPFSLRVLGHRLEDAGDATSRRAIAELFSGERPLLEVIKLKDLYGLLEDALDRCEDVANVLEGIATKNA